MVTCIIFDCDGVLVDSEMIAARVAADCFTEAGMPITAEELTRRFSGIAGDQVTVQLAAQFGVAPDAAMTEKRRHRIMTAFASELKAIPGVDCALDSLWRLSSRLTCCV
jgi:beta-phosphoglucomutase-like phosphatase (HAD superfamily)